MSGSWKPIPGETPVDPSGLKDRSIRTRSQLNRVEAENILKATLKYLSARPSKRTAPFTYDWFLRLHKEMFGEVWDWAGQVRTLDVNLGIPWDQIGQHLGGLILDMECWRPTEDRILEQAATLHFRAVCIHPFLNGNGRWSRMLANIWLKQNGFSPVAWPEPQIGTGASATRGEYIDAITTAIAGDMIPLIELHQRFWEG